MTADWTRVVNGTVETKVGNGLEKATTCLSSNENQNKKPNPASTCILPSLPSHSRFSHMTKKS